MTRLFRGHPAIWIGRRKEREVLKLSQRHFGKIEELAKMLRKFLNSFMEGNLEDMKKLHNEIFVIEREADDVKEEIISEISRGPFHPIDREDIMRLVLTMDDIASNIKAASRKMLYLDPENIPAEVKGEFPKLGDMLVEIISRLGQALDALIEGSHDVLRLADFVERKEEEIDDFRVDLMAKILKWGDKTRELSSLLMLKEAVENLENASDRAEDVADIIRGIVALRI